MTIAQAVGAAVVGAHKGAALAVVMATITPSDVLSAYWQWLPVVVTLASVLSNVVPPDTKIGKLVRAIAMVPPHRE